MQKKCSSPVRGELSRTMIQKAIDLSIANVTHNLGGPFGAVIVKDDIIIAQGANMVTATNDPTAHAEMVAIRNACKVLNTFQLTGCQMYTSCEPCPMCFGALYWARVDVIYYANTKADAAAINFDDSFIYDELNKPHEQRKIPCIKIENTNALEAFTAWQKQIDKIKY